MIYLIGIPAFLVIVFMVMRRNQKKITEARAKKRRAERYFDYDASRHCLTLKKHNPVIREVLSIKESHDIIGSYTPDKVIYTGVTVGGVTTGGFDTVKGGYSMSLGEKTGRYYVSYDYAEDLCSNGELNFWGGLVSFIELSERDYAEIENDENLKCFIATDETKKKFNLEGRRILNLINISSFWGERLIDWLSRADPEGEEDLDEPELQSAKNAEEAKKILREIRQEAWAESKSTRGNILNAVLAFLISAIGMVVIVVNMPIGLLLEALAVFFLVRFLKRARKSTGKTIVLVLVILIVAVSVLFGTVGALS